MGKRRGLRIIFQSITTGFFVLLTILLLCMIDPMPKLSMFTGKLTISLISLFVSCLGLIYILIRFTNKNVRKWEVILYNILNIVFIVIILISLISSFESISDILNKNYNYEYENAIWGSMFIYALLLMWTPFPTIMPLTLSILSIVFGLKKEKKKEVETKTEEAPKENSTQEPVPAKTTLYCAYCGKPIDYEGKFCKYWGKEH